MPFVKVPEYTEYQKLRNSRPFKALMEQCIELAADIKAFEAQYRDAKDALDELLTNADVSGSVAYNGWRVSLVDKAPGQKLNMKKLLRVLGPKGPSLVKQAMEPTAGSHYVQIAPPSANDKGEADDEG